LPEEDGRRLAAIMFTDVAGYTSLSERDEALALQLLEEHRIKIRPILQSHNGREIKTVGDAFLVEFSSALEATRCAFDIQQSMHEMNAGRSSERQFQIRIGIHLGDVVHTQGDVYGDAVNLASRIEPLAAPGGICVSQQVYDQVRNKFEFPFANLGKKTLKNVGEAAEVYKVVLPWEDQQLKEEEYPANRIAILPFTSYSPDPNDAFFADGITEEIISTVAGLSGLNVISRTSVMGYKGTTKKVGEIGKELKVGSILEGSLRKAGNRIRVTTQLIDVAGDRHLWAQNYDRNLDDVFEVQSDVAKQVAEALRVRILTPEKERIEKKPTENAAAYTLYLKGRQLWNTRRLENIKKALELFEQSVKEDPNFALGYAGQADCFTLLRVNFRIDADANMQRAKALAAKALELDPNLAEAHATLADNLGDERKFEESEEEFRKAIKLKPGYATAHQWYSLLLRRLFRWEEGLQELEKAAELDPLSQTIVSSLSGCLASMGRTEEALRVIEAAERLDPNGLYILRAKAGLFLFLGRLTEAGDLLERAAKLYADDVGLLDQQGHYDQLVGNYSGAIEKWEKAVKLGKEHGGEVTGFNADYASVYWLKGEKDKALACINEIEAMPEETYDTHNLKLLLLACGYAGIGNADGFFDAVSRLIEAKAPDFSWLRYVGITYPSSQEFNKDPRWRELFRSVGLKP
jgi:adenylate cyclase